MARLIQTAGLDGLLPADDSLWVYNGLDCCVTLEVFNKISTYLDHDASRIYDLSRQMQPAILEMQLRGILVDENRRRKVIADLKGNMHRLQENLSRILKEGLNVELNWRSPTQLKELLYNILDLPVKRTRSATGGMVATTGRAALEELSGYFHAEPIINHILLLRDLGKELSFLETGIDPDGYIRCNYNIAGTNTGRLASSLSDFGTGTNLQNIKRALRSIFVAERGQKFINIDLEQADSRNVGANCWNKFVEEHGEAFAGSYLDACESGDLHTFVTRMARPSLEWGDDPVKWRAIADQLGYRGETYRDLSKKLGHGTNYYGQPPTMARHSKVPVQDVDEFQQNYFQTFPCIKAGHEQTKQQLKELGQITTLWGRRRCFFGRPTDERTIRQAIAFEGQSPTADEINLGMVNLFARGICQLRAQVHDSLLVSIPEEREPELIPQIKDALTVKTILKRDREFFVPVEIKTGWNWGDILYWTAEDVAKGLCKPEQINSIRENPDGLKKWKGGDDRKRNDRPKAAWSIWNL